MLVGMFVHNGLQTWLEQTLHISDYTTAAHPIYAQSH